MLTSPLLLLPRFVNLGVREIIVGKKALLLGLVFQLSESLQHPKARAFSLSPQPLMCSFLHSEEL
jgi:hypothetical protein